MIEIHALHLGTTLNAKARLERSAALDLVDPDEPDEAATGRHLCAIDESPRAVVAVVLNP